MKKCTTCLTLKSFEDFSVRRAAKDGLSSKCRTCSNQYQIDHRKEPGIREKQLKYDHDRWLQDEEFRKSQAEWKRKDREDNWIQYADKDLQKNFGITWAQRAAILESQNGRCRICKITEEEYLQQQKDRGVKKRPRLLSVDHCHKSGKVRGILCHYCNLVLGLIRDNTDVAKSIIEYLESF